jgi:hypothetical protein
MTDFWQRCADAGCVIVPVNYYHEGYDDFDELVGSPELRFSAIKVFSSEVTPEYGVQVDDWSLGFYDTPEAALEAFEKENAR